MANIYKYTGLFNLKYSVFYNNVPFINKERHHIKKTGYQYSDHIYHCFSILLFFLKTASGTIPAGNTYLVDAN